MFALRALYKVLTYNLPAGQEYFTPNRQPKTNPISPVTTNPAMAMPQQATLAAIATPLPALPCSHAALFQETIAPAASARAAADYCHAQIKTLEPLPPQLRAWVTQPILSFDLESTGKDPTATTTRIVEFSAVLLLPSGACAAFTSVINPADDSCFNVASSNIHKIRRQDVQGKPNLAQAMRAFQRFCQQRLPPQAAVILTGFNIQNYDLPLLRRELQAQQIALPRVFQSAAVVDILQLYRCIHGHGDVEDRRNLAAVRLFYKNFLPPRADAMLHSAQQDACLAADLLPAMRWFDAQYAGQRPDAGHLPATLAALPNFVAQHPETLRQASQAAAQKLARLTLKRTASRDTPPRKRCRTTTRAPT